MNKKKILLVDDELVLRDTICEILSYENYEVKTTCNGLEALKLLENWTPDLIISDIMMPIMDGNLFHEKVLANRFLRTIPFVFLTAKKGEHILRDSMLEGADDFLFKPFKAEELLRVIETRINRFLEIKSTAYSFDLSKNNYLLHELNTSLNGILGSIELLIDNGESLKKDEVAIFYDAIKVSGERLNRIIKNLALFQNLKNNLIQFTNSESTEISKIFSKTSTKLSSNWFDSRFEINAEIAQETLKINPDFMSFVLFELIDNAIKFSNTPAKVYIFGKRIEEALYEIEIQDYGIGLSSEEIEKIDEMSQFNREEIEQEGIGLGLFLSKTIIAKSNGTFDIVSKKGEGTSIKIKIPILISSN